MYSFDPHINRAVYCYYPVSHMGQRRHKKVTCSRSHSKSYGLGLNLTVRKDSLSNAAKSELWEVCMKVDTANISKKHHISPQNPEFS